MIDINVERTNIEGLTKGVWVSYNDEVSFRIARTSNDNAVALREKLVNEWKEETGFQGSTEELTEETLFSISKVVIASEIIKDWKGVKEKIDGKMVDLPYSPEKALEIISDRRYESLFNWILQQAQNIQNFREKVREDDEKKP